MAADAGSRRLGVDGALIDGRRVDGDVEVADGRITRVGLPAAGTSLFAAPAFVDLQVNGYAGVDLLDADEDAVLHAARTLRGAGVAAWQPTLISSPEPDIVRTLQVLDRARAQTDGADILPAHLEGPFISAERLGTHSAQHRRDPDPSLLERLLTAGRVGYVTLAPELPGALALIAALRARDVVVSLGHTDASSSAAHAGFDAGAGTVTHLFNAMRRFTARDAGIVGAALTRDDVVVQVIVDHHHLHPDTVRLVWRAAAGRTALVTDAISATGIGEGDFTLGDVRVTVAEGAVRRADGTLAGSVLTMADAVHNLVGLGVTVAEAAAAASEVPARVLGRDDLGRLGVGRRADLVLLDEHGTLLRTVRGDEILEAP